MPVHPSLEGSTFDADLRDKHLTYDYNARDENGNPQKWRYELWIQNEDRVVYEIHGGPMAGRCNYQATTYSCIRPGELWQMNWLEETGTIVSLVWDIINNRITTLIAFSKGHWEHNVEAHGDKRNPEDLERWRRLAKIGTQKDRHMLSEQADILSVTTGAQGLKPVTMDMPCL